MTIFASILVPLDGSETAAGSLGCATWLAARLGARLHILSATPRELPAHEELRRLHVAEQYWPMVELHQAPAYPPDAILAAIVQYDARLVVMTARGASSEEPPAADGELATTLARDLATDDARSLAKDIVKLIGHVTQAVIERSIVPVLLLPPRYRERLPWQRVLVPVSGGTESDAALAFAVRLASALDLAVYVAHVVGAGTARDEGLADRTRYSDALYYEVPAQLEEMVSRAIPAIDREDCRCIRSIALGHGAVASELLQLMERDQISGLVVGWHGRFEVGRAAVLKDLLLGMEAPILLVKSVGPELFRLKVGGELE